MIKMDTTLPKKSFVNDQNGQGQPICRIDYQPGSYLPIHLREIKTSDVMIKTQLSRISRDQMRADFVKVPRGAYSILV